MYIPGRVIRVISNEGVVIEAVAAFIQGIFDLEEEDHGVINVAMSSPEEALIADNIIEVVL